MNQIKSRDISILEYLECLIKEYFQAEMRAQTYRKRSDKNYWRRTARHKQSKIEDITKRNRIPSIFSDDDTYNRYYDKYYAMDEMPSLFDNDKDIKMYYSVGNDVTVNDEGKILVGRIHSTDLRQGVAEVNLFDDNSLQHFNLQDIRRIL